MKIQSCYLLPSLYVSVLLKNWGLRFTKSDEPSSLTRLKNPSTVECPNLNAAPAISDLTCHLLLIIVFYHFLVGIDHVHVQSCLLVIDEYHWIEEQIQWWDQPIKQNISPMPTWPIHHNINSPHTTINIVTYSTEGLVWGSWPAKLCSLYLCIKLSPMISGRYS